VDRDETKLLEIAQEIASSTVGELEDKGRANDEMIIAVAKKSLTGIDYDEFMEEGFFWKADITVWELEMGSRLAELCREKFNKWRAEHRKNTEVTVDSQEEK